MGRVRPSPAELLTLATIPLAVLLAVSLMRLERPRAGARTASLTLFCAAGLRPAVDAAVQAFESETRISVAVDYRGSGALLSALRVRPEVDLFLPADDSYLDRAAEFGWVGERETVAEQWPVALVAEGNPKSVHSLRDCLREEVRLSLGDPEVAAIGRRTREAAVAAGLWPALLEHAVVTQPTVQDVAKDVELGAADVCIVWSSTVSQFPGLERVTLPELEGRRTRVELGVHEDTAHPAEALCFLRYLTAADRGLPAFARQGFTVAAGDRWAFPPVLQLQAGAMLRPALEPVLDRFEAREGVEIQRVYDSGGALVSQMRAGSRPDAVLSLDPASFDLVHDRFRDPVPLFPDLGDGPRAPWWGVAVDSDFPRLLRRLETALLAPASREGFQSLRLDLEGPDR